MKKSLIAVASILAFANLLHAQENPLIPSRAFDNMSITLKGGVASPLNPSQGSIWTNFRGLAGMEVRKQITPGVGIGVEGEALFNSSTWNGQASMLNVVDNSYVGLFGAFNLSNILGGYIGTPRIFEMELVGGIGWLHGYVPKSQGNDYNDLGIKTGMNMNFNLGKAKAWSLNIKPGIIWNVTNTDSHIMSPRSASLEIEAGITYHFGNSNGTHSFAFYECDFTPYNDQINELRGMLESCADDVFVLESACADLNQQLKDCQNKPAKVVTNTVVQNNNSLESVRYVFFRVGSSKITSDQQPNVEMIAEYMKNHPESTVVITGYASKDGNLDFNIRLAQARAENVKNMLTKGFGIKPDRIKAEGQGVGSMFQEESWNRVAICVLHEATK